MIRKAILGRRGTLETWGDPKKKAPHMYRACRQKLVGKKRILGWFLGLQRDTGGASFSLERATFLIPTSPRQTGAEGPSR